MTRILFTATPGAGHFTPVVPFLRGAAAHADVLLAGPEALRAHAERLGAAFAPVDEPTPPEFGAAVARAAAAGPGGDAVIIRDLFVGLRAARALPRVLELCRRWRPDVVVHEEAEFAGPLAAVAHGLPLARVAIGLTETSDVFAAHAAEPVAALAGDHGLEPPDLAATPALTLFPEVLEAAAGGASRFRDPEWERLRGRGERDLVYVSFGTVARQIPQVRAVFGEALAAVDGIGPVVLTVGHGFDPSMLGEVPANVTVLPWVDQARVLPRARAVVCHGGGGTTLAALAAGCPVVAVPLFSGDQFINARRVEAVGAGRTALPQAAAIHAALTGVLDDPRHRSVAGDIADELSAQRSADDVLDGLLTAV